MPNTKQLFSFRKISVIVGAAVVGMSSPVAAQQTVPSGYSFLWTSIGGLGIDDSRNSVMTVVNPQGAFRGYRASPTAGVTPLSTATLPGYTLTWNRGSGISNGNGYVVGGGSFMSAISFGAEWQTPSSSAAITFTPYPEVGGSIFATPMNRAILPSVNSSRKRLYNGTFSTGGVSVAAGVIDPTLASHTNSILEIGYLGTSRPFYTVGNSINNANLIVGISGNPVSYKSFACRYRPAANRTDRCPMTDLGTLTGFNFVHAADVSEARCGKSVAVGWAANSRPADMQLNYPPDQTGRPVFWRLAESTSGAITKEGPYFLPMPQNPEILGGGTAAAAFATGISSDRGEIVGFACPQTPSASNPCAPGTANHVYAVRWQLANFSNPDSAYVAVPMLCPQDSSCNPTVDPFYVMVSARDASANGSYVGLAYNMFNPENFYGLRITRSARPAVTCPVVSACPAVFEAEIADAAQDLAVSQSGVLSAETQDVLTRRITTTPTVTPTSACAVSYKTAYVAVLDAYRRITRRPVALSSDRTLTSENTLSKKVIASIVQDTAKTLGTTLDEATVQHLVTELDGRRLATDRIVTTLVPSVTRCCRRVVTHVVPVPTATATKATRIQ